MATYENENGRLKEVPDSIQPPAQTWSMTELQEMIETAQTTKEELQGKITLVDSDIVRIQALIDQAVSLGVS